MLKIGQKSNLSRCFLIKYFEQIAFHDLLKQCSPICFIKNQRVSQHPEASPACISIPIPRTPCPIHSRKQEVLRKCKRKFLKTCCHLCLAFSRLSNPQIFDTSTLRKEREKKGGGSKQFKCRIKPKHAART